MQVLSTIANVLAFAAFAAFAALAYFRLKDWRMLSGLARMLRIRDVLFGGFACYAASWFLAIFAARMLSNG